MFDSENISLVTRIEAGTGVAIAYSTNSEGESIYTASIDSDYLVNLIKTNVGGTLTLSSTDEARIAAIEAKLGLTTTPTPTPPVVASGTTGTTEINCSVNGSDTGVTSSSKQIQLTYSLVGIDGTTLISENLQASAGAAANILELGIYSQMRRNAGMLKYMTPSYANGKVVLTWNAGQAGSTFKVVVTQKDDADTITFTVTDY